MEYKILESNGVEIENIDGAALNNFITGYKSGIVANVGKSCNLIPYSNTLTIDTGLIIVSGFRVKILQPISFILTGSPAYSTDYQLVLKITLNKDRSVLSNLFVREMQVLTQNNLLIEEEGVYEFEIASFRYNVDGTISSIQKSKLLTNSLSAELDSKADKSELELKADKEITYKDWIEIYNQYDYENSTSDIYICKEGLHFTTSPKYIKGSIRVIQISEEPIEKDYSFEEKLQFQLDGYNPEATITIGDGIVLRLTYECNGESNNCCTININSPQSYILVGGIISIAFEEKTDTLANFVINTANNVGDIDRALDTIIEIQNSLIGGNE